MPRNLRQLITLSGMDIIMLWYLVSYGFTMVVACAAGYIVTRVVPGHSQLRGNRVRRKQMISDSPDNPQATKHYACLHWYELMFVSSHRIGSVLV
jgi:hypothetical protein